MNDIFESEENATQPIRWAVPRACRHTVAQGEDVVVWVDPTKIDADWAKDRNFYVGPGGTVNAIGRRYANFGEWLKGGEAVEMSEVGLDYLGRPYFSNGRHRFAWLRDHGARAIPVIVDSTDGKLGEFVQRYGTKLRQTVIHL